MKLLDVMAELWRRASAPAEPAPATIVQGGLVLPVERCYPLRALADSRTPTITSRHKIHNPSRPTHYGVDFFYRYQVGDPPMRIGDGGRTSKWWIPPGTLALAAAAGVVELAGDSSTGHRVWIRHAGGLATGYFHLRYLSVGEGDRVELGQPLGEVGDNPNDKGDAAHLHWEVYRGLVIRKGAVVGYPSGTCDPEVWLRGAKLLAA